MEMARELLANLGHDHRVAGQLAPDFKTRQTEEHGMVRPVTSFSRLRTWASRIQRDGVTLWFAARNTRTPWYAKALGALVVAYALSPIDLIPDFIPVFGFIDDVLLLPGLIWLTIKLLPADVLAECRSQADEWLTSNEVKPTSKAGAALIVLLWLLACCGVWYLVESGRSS